MCAAVLHDTAVVLVADASRDDRFRDNPFVTGEIGRVRFYASAALTTPEGTVIGRLCVFDDEPRGLRPEQRELLTSLAERVVDALELRLRSRQLEESLARLTLAQDELHRSNEKLALFAGQISHDLRTPLTALLANVEMLAEEPAVTDDAMLSHPRRRGAARGAPDDRDDRGHPRPRAARRRPAAGAGGPRRGRRRRAARPASGGRRGRRARRGGSAAGGLRRPPAALRRDAQPALQRREVPASRGRAGRSRCVRAPQGRGHRIEVRDNGPGVPAGQRERVFDLYARADSDDPRAAASGWPRPVGSSRPTAARSASRPPPGGGTTRVVLAPALTRRPWSPPVSGPASGHRPQQGLLLVTACRNSGREPAGSDQDPGCCGSDQKPATGRRLRWGRDGRGEPMVTRAARRTGVITAATPWDDVSDLPLPTGPPSTRDPQRGGGRAHPGAASGAGLAAPAARTPGAARCAGAGGRRHPRLAGAGAVGCAAARVPQAARVRRARVGLRDQPRRRGGRQGPAGGEGRRVGRPSTAPCTWSAGASVA